MRTPEIALMPDASILGLLPCQPTRAQASADHGIRLTRVTLSKILYISAELWAMNGSSSLSNLGMSSVTLFAASCSSVHVSSIASNLPTFTSAALTKLLNFTDHSSKFFWFP
jgi:hypothetical protein